MKNFLILIVLILIVSNAFSANIGDDKTNIGQKGSTEDKLLIFRDANKSHIQVDHTNGYFSFGDGANSTNKRIGFDIGLGASNPFFEWDVVKGKIRFSNDGSSSKDIGSGSGSGGGGNFNNAFTADDNANAEDGTTGWTASAGSFSVTSTLASWVTSTSYSIGDIVVESNVVYTANTAHTSGVFATDIANWDKNFGSESLEGEESFTWVPNAQNDTLDSPVLSFDRDIMKGNACQTEISYIGGDENLTLQVINADNEVVGSEVLKVHTRATYESVFFICPSDADIIADADKGNLRFRLLNEGASASALIKFDKNYVGTLIGLSETTLPDVFSAYIDAAGNVSRENVDWIDGSCVISGTSIFTCTYISGLVVNSMNCQTTTEQNTNGILAVMQSSSSTELVTRTELTTTATDSPRAHVVTCTKQGVDAKQSVQVYKAIPKISENENNFNSRVGSTGSVNTENIDFINGNCVASGSGNYTCTYINGIFTVEPVTTCTTDTTNGHCSIHSASASGFQVRTRLATTTTPTDMGFYVEVSKQSADYKTGTVQQISLAGMVVNSYAEASQKQVRAESCRIDNSGTPSSSPDSGLCESWVDSLIDNSPGNTSLEVPGIFSKKPICTCITTSSSGLHCLASSISASSITVITYNNSHNQADFNFQITCTGVK